MNSALGHAPTAATQASALSVPSSAVRRSGGTVDGPWAISSLRIELRLPPPARRSRNSPIPVRHADLVEEAGQQLARDQVEHFAAEQEVVLVLAGL